MGRVIEVAVECVVRIEVSDEDAITRVTGPANRCEQGWWQRHVEPRRDGPASRGLRVQFLPGRLRFIAHDDTEIRPNARPPFGCALLVWSSIEEVQRAA